MYLQIPYTIARQISDHAKTQAPEEACGLLVGSKHTITQAIEIENVADTPQNRYKLHPIQYLQALKRIDRVGLNWLGIYHSHPTSPPIPSETDIREANEFDIFHVIVSLENTKPTLKAWQIESDYSVKPIELLFDTQTPTERESLTNSQKIAIILTGIISVLLLLVISFTLLPPAPQITPVP